MLNCDDNTMMEFPKKKFLVLALFIIVLASVKVFFVYILY